MKPTILFTGGSGLLAVNWALAICNDFTVVSILHKKNISIPGIQCIKIDISNSELFLDTLQQIRPAIVIHCVSLTSVEGCEENPRLAYQTNVILTEVVATACAKQNIRLVYISTDHLFSGKEPLVAEDVPVDPQNAYGQTKAIAEEKALQLCENTLAIRTNFYGWGTTYRRSFSDHIIQCLRHQKQVNLFQDFFYTPILIEDLALTVMDLLQAGAQGIFNVAGNLRISKLDFGLRIAKQFNLDASLIKASKFSERTDLVKRPVDISLSVKKTISFLGRNIGDIDQNIHRLYEQEQTTGATIKNI